MKEGTIEDDDFTDDITDDDPLIDPDEDLEDSAIIDQVHYNKKGVTDTVRRMEKGLGYAKLKRFRKKPKKLNKRIRDMRRKIRNNVIDRIKIIRVKFSVSQKVTMKKLKKLQKLTTRLHREAYYKIQGAFKETNAFIAKVRHNYHKHLKKNKNRITWRRKAALTNWVNGRIKFSKLSYTKFRKNMSRKFSA